MSFERCRVGGFAGWRASDGPVEVCFAGKGSDPRSRWQAGGRVPVGDAEDRQGAERETALRRILPAGVEPSWLRQIHSATVLDACPGDNGPGDALISRRRGLALSVVTADCVPVLLAGESGIAAVHAGWRGLARSILPAARERLGRAPVTAWIGPAIGACCYEVDHDVARDVSAASSSAVVRDGPRGRPHLDLVAAARIQLERLGEVRVHSVGACTRCQDDQLWSYRRDGAAAGRNLAVIWRQA